MKLIRALEILKNVREVIEILRDGQIHADEKIELQNAIEELIDDLMEVLN